MKRLNRFRFWTLVALVLVLTLALPWTALASSVDVAVVDVTAPTGSVTLSPGGSGSITINMTVTGKQEGTATFKVYRDWTLSGGSFAGSNSQTFTVPPRAASDPATFFSTSGTVSVATAQGAGTFTLAVSAFDITNSNQTGAKLSDGADSNYQVTVSPPADTTPPTVSCTVPDQTSWYATDQSVPCTASDPSGATPSSFTLSTSVSAGTETASALTSTQLVCDGVGNCTTAGPVGPFKIDKKAPQLSSCDAPDGAWHASDVTLYCTYTDGGSGPATQQVSLSTSVAAGDETANAVASAGGAQACDAVGNCAASPADIAGNKIDKKAPSITWNSGINDGDSFYYGDVPATPTCTAADLGSGPKSCTVSGYSAEVGPHTLTATAYDNVDNKAEETRSYTVLAWTLSGFYQPVDMGGLFWNTVKGGSTVPFKFEVFKGTTELTDVSVVKSFTAAPVACPVTGYTADEIEFTTTGGTVLRYDFTAGQFIQNWQTPKKPGACYMVTMTTKDGSSLSANFKLK